MKKESKSEKLIDIIVLLFDIVITIIFVVMFIIALEPLFDII